MLLRIYLCSSMCIHVCSSVSFSEFCSIGMCLASLTLVWLPLSFSLLVPLLLRRIGYCSRLVSDRSRIQTRLVSDPAHSLTQSRLVVCCHGWPPLSSERIARVWITERNSAGYQVDRDLMARSWPCQELVYNRRPPATISHYIGAILVGRHHYTEGAITKHNDRYHA